MYDQGRRRVGRDPVDGRRLPVHVGRGVHRLLHDPALEDLAQTLVVRAVSGPVEDAVERDHRPHRRVDVLEPGLQLRIVGGEADERGEMTTRGATGDDHVVGVASVVRDVGADPRQRALAVEQVVGPGRAARGDS